MSPKTSPTDTQADRAFARFCRTGDAEALGEVFDRTAPRLALLAGHLVPGDAQAVEDLVQTTFVEAMRSAPRFTPGRAVLPWLVTILGRRAANWRRDRGRRSTEALMEAGDASLDPARMAADRELAERVAATIEGLAAPYREVLALRLVHALSPAEIARALDRPLGTVHSQLQRGGERLRRLLAPAVAVALGNVLHAGDGLAAVRARVLTFARELAVTAPAGVAGLGSLLVGGLMVKKLAIAAAALALVALALFVSPLGQRAAPTPPVTGAPPIAITSSGTTAAAEDGTALERLQQRAVLPEIAAEAVTFRGRVVLAESGAPVAGAEVEVQRFAKHVRRGADNLLSTTTTTTGRDGRYRVRVAPEADVAIGLRARHPGRATMSASFWEPLRPGADVDCGDVPLGPGADLSLRVHDESGTPIPAFEIQLRPPATELSSTDGSFRPSGWNGIQKTDRNGLAGPRRVLAGVWRVEFAEGTGHRYLGPSAITVPADRTAVLIDLPVATPDLTAAVAGVVVDERGEPLVGVDVCARQAHQFGFRSEASFGDGRFHLPNWRPQRGPVQIFRVGPGSGERGDEFELLEPKQPVAIGARDVRVVVRRLPRTEVTVRVVDARDRAPVTAFRATVLPIVQGENTRLRGSLQMPPSTVHEGGRLGLGALPPGDHLLIVAADDPELQPVAFVEFDPVAHAGGLEVLLQPSVRWRVRVTDASGEPLAGSTVELVRGVGSRTVARRSTSTHTWRDAFDAGVSGTSLAVATASATTGADGVATLRSAADVERCGLRVRGAGHLPHFEQLAGTVADGALLRTVTVTPAARLIGRLGPTELLAELGPTAAERARAERYADPEIGIGRLEVEIGQQPDGGSRQTTVDDDGRFTFDALPPGDYVVRVDPPRQRGSAALGVVRALRAGEQREVAFDLAAARPAQLTGRVLVNGAPPPADSRLALDGATVALDPAGRFEHRALPGAWTCRLETPGADALTLPDLALQPGESTERTLAFTLRHVDLHVAARDGTDLGGCWIVLHRGEDGLPGSRTNLLRLRDDGHVTANGTWDEPRFAVLWLDPPPYGAPRDRLPTPGRSIVLGRIEVPAGETSASYEFTVDTGKH